MPHPEAEHSLRIQLATALRDHELTKDALGDAFKELREVQSALAAARLAYQPICERVCGDDGEHVTACIRVRKALAAPGAAPGEEGTR